MKSFNVLRFNFNTKKVEPFNVLPYFIEQYKNSKDKPKTIEEFKKFIERKAKYEFWGRCEYEIIICGWPNIEDQEKWDVYSQIMINIDLITNLLIEEINGNK